MKEQYNSSDRKKLMHKMTAVFGENIQMLSVDLQEILLDDLVTAFENRLEVLNRVKSDFEIKAAECTNYETIKA
jgi:hypothetical protein